MERHSATLAQETENDLGLQIEYLSFAGLNMPAVSIGMCGRNPLQSADHLRTLKFLGYSNFARATTFSQSTQGLKCHRPTFPVAQDPKDIFDFRNCGYT